MSSETSDTDAAASPKTAPDYVRELAARLALIHGPATISKEENGWHIRIASPKALAEDGVRELKKRHLYVNADKLYNQGKWRKRKSTSDVVAYDIKHKQPYSVAELLAMKPLAARGIVEKVSTKVTDNGEPYLIVDANGNKIPDHPGRVVPVTLLPKTHAMRQYLESRNFTVQDAWRFCRASYCTEAAPEGEEYGRRFWRRMTCGTRDWPAHRMIMYVDMNGVQVGWQARYLERVEGEFKYHWVSVNDRPPAWIPIYRKNSEGGWDMHADFSDSRWPYSPGKYLNARGQKRNSVIMGLDGAIEINGKNGTSFVCVVEGPTDALRLFGAGLPVLAVMGKFLSQEQSATIAKHFSQVVLIPDTDAVGLEAEVSFREKLSAAKVDVVTANLTERFGAKAKDAGDLTPHEASVFAEHVRSILTSGKTPRKESEWGYNA